MPSRSLDMLMRLMNISVGFGNHDDDYNNITSISGSNSEVSLRKRREFMSHTYRINSLSPCSDGTTFISSDDLRINLWHFEHDQGVCMWTWELMWWNNSCWKVVMTHPVQSSSSMQSHATRFSLLSHRVSTWSCCLSALRWYLQHIKWNDERCPQFYQLLQVHTTGTINHQQHYGHHRHILHHRHHHDHSCIPKLEVALNNLPHKKASYDILLKVVLTPPTIAKVIGSKKENTWKTMSSAR